MPTTKTKKPIKAAIAKKPVAKKATKPVHKAAVKVAKRLAKAMKKPPLKKPAKPSLKKVPPANKKLAGKAVFTKVNQKSAKPGKVAPKVTLKVAAKPSSKPSIKVATKQSIKPITKMAAKSAGKAVPRTAEPMKKDKNVVLAPAEIMKGKAKGAKSAVVVEGLPEQEVEKKVRGRKPKVEEAVVPGTDVRTDRQKARDRKAKEKALLKEFAAQQLGSEEQQELRRARLKMLIKMGKSKGYLTHGEMNDVMSDELSDADALETLIGLLNDIGITVYEQAPDAETLLLNENGVAGASEEEAEEEAEAALSTVDSEFGRTTDPVRMYMREMGTVDLLTREGEIVIAKKIEAGLKDMVMALSACPVTIGEILANAEKIAAGEMEIDQFVDGLVDPNAEDIKLGPEEPEVDLDAIGGEEEGEEGFKNIDELIDELRDKRDQFQDELSTLNSEIDKVYLYPFEGIEVNKDDEEYLEKMYRKPEPYIFNLASTQS